MNEAGENGEKYTRMTFSLFPNQVDFINKKEEKANENGYDFNKSRFIRGLIDEKMEEKGEKDDTEV